MKNGVIIPIFGCKGVSDCFENDHLWTIPLKKKTWFYLVTKESWKQSPSVVQKNRAGLLSPLLPNPSYICKCLPAPKTAHLTSQTQIPEFKVTFPLGLQCSLLCGHLSPTQDCVCQIQQSPSSVWHEEGPRQTLLVDDLSAAYLESL